LNAVTLKTIKAELQLRDPSEWMELCLRMAKFKKENKELLTYLLFESGSESSYVENLKAEMDQQFAEMNMKTWYLTKKGSRKILTGLKRAIRYSGIKETEIEVLLYFCSKLKAMRPSIQKNTRMLNMYTVQIELIKRKIKLLHEDLQFDYGKELEKLTGVTENE